MKAIIYLIGSVALAIAAWIGIYYLAAYVIRNNQAKTEQLDRIEAKQDSILKVNQEFRTYHLENCSFTPIEK